MVGVSDRRNGGAATDGRQVLRRRCRGRSCSAFWASSRLPSAMEACATAHDWGRAISGLGHDVRLVPPIYIKPFVRRQKNDAADAEAIAEGGLKADDALCGVEDGRAASATHDLSHARPFGAAANPVGQCTARPSGGAWDCPRPRACPGESSWRLRCETRAHSTRSCAS